MILHVWHRLVANLEMNSYNSLDDRIIKCIAKLVAFMQNVVKLAPYYKALQSPWSHFIFGL